MSEWAENEQSRVRLITEYATAPRSGPIRLGLHFTLSPGWHVYWKNSGDAGFPPVVTFASTEGALQKAELFWPAPRRFELPGGLVAFGYEKEAVYPIQATLEVPAGAAAAGTSDLETAGAGESVAITAEVDYLVCEVDCIPYRYTLALTQPVGDEAVADPETSRLLDSWWARLPKPAGEIPGVQTGALVHAADPEKLELEVRVRGAQAGQGETDLFLETHEAFETGKPQVRVAAGEVVFRVPLAAKEAGKELPAKTVFAWTVTGLSREGEPVSLEARREVEVSREPAGGKPAAVAPAGETGAAYRARLFRLLLLALLGGLLLNLTPTVLPLLFGELMALRDDPGGRPAVREGAAAVATGVLGSCMAMAALAGAARRAGLPAGWGAQLQEPALAALILVAAVVLTLNLWGLLEVPLASADPADPADRPKRGGTARHLLAGLFTTPLALAWTLPLLREPVGFAAEKGPAVTLTVLAALGLGLSVPYLLLILAPAAIRVVPASGRWSRVLREGMGFLAGASTFWLLYALSRQVSPEGIAWVELALLVMALLAWLRHRAVSRGAIRFGLAVALVACAAAALWLADDNRLSPRPSRTADNQRNILTGG